MTNTVLGSLYVKHNNIKVQYHIGVCVFGGEWGVSSKEV